MSKKIFISYKHFEERLNNNDETVARRLYDKIRSAGFECWMDKMNMPVITDSWISDIVTAIEKCDLVVMVVSKHSQESKTIRLKELRVISDNNKPTIPFRIDKSELLPEFEWELSSPQWIEAWDDYESKIDELISRIRLELGDPKDPTPKTPNDNLIFTVSNVQFIMIHVQGGKFMMGEDCKRCLVADKSEEPIHEVELSNYWIGQTPVTQELWTSVMGNNPSKYLGVPNCPVVNISWDDCQVFIKVLNAILKKELLQFGNIRFCLPSEAEWEFAARGGNKSQGFIYSGGNNIEDVGWIGFRPNSVAEKSPNELGIYDMSGNVFEWCQDSPNDYDNQEVQKNPIIELSNQSERICRGGSWKTYIKWCRVSYRHRFNATNKDQTNLGLRLVLRQF